MSEYDNNNRGALFKNNKRENDRQPEYTGTVEVNHVEYYLSAWVKESKTGQKFFSLAFTPKDATKKQPEGSSPAPQDPVDVNSEIPF